jgi:hypothetical protein
MVLGGDSGGPVFYQNTAYGITSGYEDDILCGGRNTLVFTSMGFATYHYDLKVLLH